MKSLMTIVVAGVLLAGVGMPHPVEAGDRDRKEWKDRRGHDRDHGRNQREARFGRRDRYFVDREVRVIREYYRPYYRPLPAGVRHRYYRAGYLPHGWRSGCGAYLCTSSATSSCSRMVITAASSTVTPLCTTRAA